MQNLKLQIKSIFLLVACSAALACQQRNVKTSKDQAQTSIPAIVSFNEHVQPIFSEYCYHCHGPDAGTRMPTKEPLRLDIEKDAFTTRDFGAPVIVKGFPEQSELVRLMHSKDSSEIMPPPENPVHIRDLHATILHSLGIDHSMLTHKFQGLDQKLTGVEPAKVISDLFA